MVTDWPSGNCPNDPGGSPTHRLEDLSAVHHHDSTQHSFRVFLPSRGKSACDSWQKLAWFLTVFQTTNKTLEEIDYIFVKGEARERLQHQVQETGRRHSLAEKSERRAETMEHGDGDLETGPGT
jgi:hypothetical protein